MIWRQQQVKSIEDDNTKSISYKGKTFNKVLAIFKLEKKGWKKLLTRKYYREEIREEFWYGEHWNFIEFMREINEDLTNTLWIKSEIGETTIYTKKKDMDVYRFQVQEQIKLEAKAKANQELIAQEAKAIDNVRKTKINLLNGLMKTLNDAITDTWLDLWKVDIYNALQVIKQLNVELWNPSDITDVRMSSELKDRLSTMWIL